jgi:hypothetical protein
MLHSQSDAIFIILFTHLVNDMIMSPALTIDYGTCIKINY